MDAREGLSLQGCSAEHSSSLAVQLEKSVQWGRLAMGGCVLLQSVDLEA